MGVTHKLHPEMVEFILSRKRADAALSCRRMADILRQEKKINISKSAVNNIFKSGRLSSSVGRRASGLITGASGTEPQDTFEIPSAKKQEIFENLRKAASIHAPIEKPGEAEIPKPAFPDAENKSSTKIIPLQPIEQSLPRGTAPDEAPLSQGMGLIILKAAQWSLTSRSIVSEILQPLFSVSQPADFVPWCEAQMFLRFLHPDGEWPLEDMGRHGAGLLNDDAPPSLTPADLQADEQKSLDALRHYEREDNMLNISVHGLQVNFSDGKTFLCDPQAVTLWDHLGQASYFSLSMKQSLFVLSERWVAHNKPLVFFCAPPAGRNISAIARLSEACKGGASRIFALHQYMGTLAQFDGGPQQRRSFLMGLWPWQDSYASWLKAEAAEEQMQNFTISFPGRQTGAKEFFYSEIRGKDIFYLDHSIAIRPASGNEIRLRMISFFETKDGPAFLGLLTNDADKNPGELWMEYFRRWPHGDENLAAEFAHLKKMNYDIGAQSLKEVLFAKIEYPDLTDGRSVVVDIQKRFCERLMDYAGQMFLRPGSKVLSRQEYLRELLKVSGRMEKTKETIAVRLSPPADSALLKPLQCAAQTINETDIHDWQGRRVVIEIA